MSTIPVEISVRHAHLSSTDWQTLFGPSTIENERSISQRPQFVAKQRVTLIGPKGSMENVAIVGPLRNYSQVELAVTDAFQLGISPPLSESGQLEDAVAVTLVGAAGRVIVPVAIVQRRHIHASPDEAAKFSLVHGQSVSVRISGPRGGVLDNVVIRVDPTFTWRLHLDTDEANALGIHPQDHAEIILG